MGSELIFSTAMLHVDSPYLWSE